MTTMNTSQKIIRLLFNNTRSDRHEPLFFIGDVVEFEYGSTTAAGIIKGGTWDSFNTFWVELEDCFSEGKFIGTSHMPITELAKAA